MSSQPHQPHQLHQPITVCAFTSSSSSSLGSELAKQPTGCFYHQHQYQYQHKHHLHRHRHRQGHSPPVLLPRYGLLNEFRSFLRYSCVDNPDKHFHLALADAWLLYKALNNLVVLSYTKAKSLRLDYDPTTAVRTIPMISPVHEAIASFIPP